MAPVYKKKTYLDVKQNGLYRVIAIPVPRPAKYPKSGAVGEVLWTSSWNGACLNIEGEKFIIPFDCIEDATPMDDDSLIVKMLENPYGVYKLLRGLWRMTKHKTVRNFMERGELPENGDELVKRNNKTPIDYDKQWDEAELAAMSGAFQNEIVS